MPATLTYSGLLENPMVQGYGHFVKDEAKEVDDLTAGAFANPECEAEGWFVTADEGSPVGMMLAMRRRDEEEEARRKEEDSRIAAEQNAQREQEIRRQQEDNERRQKETAQHDERRGGIPPQQEPPGRWRR